MDSSLAAPYVHVGGSCWSKVLDAEQFPGWDDPTDPSRSCLLLSEDGRELGPPHTGHELIIRDGGGAFSHWSGALWFSTSDNSDPNSNGRTYRAALDEERYFARRAAYAVDTVNSWATFLPGGLEAFRDRAVLEIGPGRDMGTALLMAALGAKRVCAVDRFTGAWRDGWHDKFIGMLGDVLNQVAAPTDRSVLDEALRARRLDVGPIEFLAQAFEAVDGSAGAFDVSVSHSTFEHFYSVEEAARVLAARTRSGGVGVHNVDFRDHAHFAAPLTFLLVDDATYADPAVNNDYGRGNRVRCAEMSMLLSQAGFSEVTFHPGMQVDDAHLDDVLRSLAAAGNPPADEQLSALRTLAGTLVLRK